MSKEHRKYQQQSVKPREQFAKQMARSNPQANNIYFPFQLAQHNYFYNCMYPYPPTPCLPYYPPLYPPPIPPRPYKQEIMRPKIEEKEEPIMEQARLKSESVQQKNYQIKVQEIAPIIKEVPRQAQPPKQSEKKNNKQLYLAEIARKFPENAQEEMNVLVSKFKKIIWSCIEGKAGDRIELSNYRDQFAKQIAQDEYFLEELLSVLHQRFKTYKKTKEELIKLIIRRTYHALRAHKNILCEKPQFQRLEAFHQKNLATFKSMNAQFLKREFSNQLFIELFKSFLTNFEQQFETENKEKVERFAYIMVSCWYDRSLNMLMHERKLPWANIYKHRIIKISVELLKEYEGSASIKEMDQKK